MHAADVTPDPADPPGIRVLHLGSPTVLNGAERWILALVKHLPRTEIESTVATIVDAPGQRPALCEHAAHLNLRVQVFEAYGRVNRRAIRQLTGYLRANHIDILHTHGYKTDILGLIAARAAGCSTVSTPHGWTTNADMKLRLYEALDRLCLCCFDAVAPLSQSLYDGLAAVPVLKRRLQLIPNGIDLAEIDGVTAPSAELAARRQRGEYLVGYIGRLVRGKRIETLIQAFARLADGNRRLCIIGDGPQRPQLERQAAQLGEAGRVRFFGYREDRLALLKALDVFVLPSASEGTPRCVLEAMAAGVPVVATDIPGCRALIEPESTGLLFKVGDAAGLAQHLERLRTNVQQRTALTQKAATMVRQKFSAAGMAARYAALYRDLMRRPGTRSETVPNATTVR